MMQARLDRAVPTAERDEYRLRPSEDPYVPALLPHGRLTSLMNRPEFERLGFASARHGRELPYVFRLQLHSQA